MKDYSIWVYGLDFASEVIFLLIVDFNAPTVYLRFIGLYERRGLFPDVPIIEGKVVNICEFFLLALVSIRGSVIAYRF